MNIPESVLRKVLMDKGVPADVADSVVEELKKITSKKTTVKMITSDGQTEDVKATVYGKKQVFVYFKERFGYNVTHIKTSAKICNTRTVKNAKELIFELEKLDCWDHSNPDNLKSSMSQGQLNNVMYLIKKYDFRNK